MEKTYKIPPEKVAQVASRYFIRLALFITPFFITVFYIVYRKTEESYVFIFKSFNTWYFLGCCFFLYAIFMAYIYYSVRSYFRDYKVEMTEDYLLVPQMLRARNGAPYYSIMRMVHTGNKLIILSEQRKLTIYTEVENMEELEKDLKSTVPQAKISNVAHGNTPVDLLNLLTLVFLLLMIFVKDPVFPVIAGALAIASIVTCFVLVIKDEASRLRTGRIVYALGITVIIVSLMLLTQLN